MPPSPSQLPASTNPLPPQIYWVGPILGSLLASSFYRFMKMLEYETANPGADFDEHEQSHFDPNIHGSRPPTIISLQQSSDPLQSHRTTGPLTDAANANPGTHTAGKWRQRGMSLWKGGRKEAGFSPAEAAQKDSEGGGTDVYDAASGAEMGNLQNGAQK